MYVGRRGVRLDLLPKRTHEHAEVLRLIGGMRAPHGLQDGAVGQHAAGMLGKKREQLELLGREPHGLAVSDHPESFPIDDQAASDHRFARRGGRVDAPKVGPDAGEQLFGAKRLGHVVVGAGVERAHLVPFRAARREHQDRDARGLPHLAAHLDAVDIRQAQIQHDEIGAVALHRRQRRTAGAGGHDLIPARPQQRSHGGDDVLFVVDDEDARRHGYCATVTARVGPGTTSVNLAPAPGTFSAQTRPPTAVINPRAIDSPIPVPDAACREARPR